MVPIWNRAKLKLNMLDLLTIACACLAVLAASIELLEPGWNKVGWGIYGLSSAVAVCNAVNLATMPDLIRWILLILVGFATVYLISGAPATLRSNPSRGTRPNWPWA
ncbi:MULTISPECIES: hypothetical protein [Ralstonia]|jgi:hypothetical protein|uniref:Uncharacterized protein n=3 Tax=Ralstonia TaxID=48736 RepID=R0CMN4_RALPI|nr:hypothetical protein [Ralstonia pickettii]ENZ77936.1 hypothetical protein OR214_02212 [Ralstonia pickettii OR214]MCM3581969.1 hypothetical protein [Ralstonia pickettii]